MAIDGNHEGKDPGWLIDSGTNSHFVVNASAFSLYCETPGQTVQGVAGSVPIKGRGDVPVVFLSRTGERTQVMLRDCAHVPDFRENLLSIPRLSKNGAQVNFTGEQVVFLAPTMGVEFGFGMKLSSASGLYVAEILSAMDLDYSMALAAMGAPIGPRRRTWEELHRIFGHAHQKAVDVVSHAKPRP